MCTVAFVPCPGGGYVLGHNRDERRRRAPGLAPAVHRRSGRSFLAPRDPDGGGTWIGLNDAGLTLCLLNALEPHPDRLPAEPKSRGLVLWDMLHLQDPSAVAAHLTGDIATLSDVRAFDLVLAHRDRPSHSTRLSWNGERLTRDDHEGPSLYVSSSLDQPGVERERGLSWHRLLESDPHPDAPTLKRWLASHTPVRGPLSVCMHRPEAKTVSRTLITASPQTLKLSYLQGSPCTTPPEDEVVLVL